MKVAFISFGCKVNRAENDDILQNIHNRGIEVSNDIKSADIAVINTCAVTEKAQKECEKYIKKLREQYPSLKIIATGCASELLGNELKYADIIVSNKNKYKIADMIGSENENIQQSAIKPHTRSFIKVQDGCDCFCTYCIIPMLRKEPRSVPLEKIIDMVNCALKSDYKEIVLTGIHIGLYGKDLNNNKNLKSLLQELSCIKGDFRIRLTSIYVDEIDDELINIIKMSDKITPHFHISLQSGSDEVLNMMGRKYKAQDFINAVKKIRDNIADAFIGIDIIAGFPGEDDKMFKNTVLLLNSLEEKYMIDSMHIFPYSKRPGTKAAEMKNQNNDAVKKLRAEKLKAIAAEQSLIRKRLMLGKTVRVLTEKDNKGHADNFYLIHIKTNIEQNKFAQIKITDIKNNKLIGEIL